MHSLSQTATSRRRERVCFVQVGEGDMIFRKELLPCISIKQHSEAVCHNTFSMYHLARVAKP